MTNKSFTLKCIGKNTDYMTIVREMEDGFVVKIVRDLDGYKDIKTDYISNESAIKQFTLHRGIQRNKYKIPDFSCSFQNLI